MTEFRTGSLIFGRRLTHCRYALGLSPDPLRRWRRRRRELWQRCGRGGVARNEVSPRLGKQGLHGHRLPAIQGALAQQQLKALDVLNDDETVVGQHNATPRSRVSDVYLILEAHAMVVLTCVLDTHRGDEPAAANGAFASPGSQRIMAAAPPGPRAPPGLTGRRSTPATDRSCRSGLATRPTGSDRPPGPAPGPTKRARGSRQSCAGRNSRPRRSAAA